MRTLRSSTRRDPSLSLLSPGLGEGSSSEAQAQTVLPSVDSLASMADGTPPNSDGERQDLAGSSPCKNPRGPACTRKSLQFASDSDDATPMSQDFFSQREKNPDRGGRAYSPSSWSFADEPRSSDTSLSRALASSSPAVDKSRSTSGRDESSVMFVPNDTCPPDKRRRSARLASKGHENSHGADDSMHVYILPVSERNLPVKGDDASDSGETGLADKRKVVGKKRLSVPRQAHNAPSTADHAVTVWETPVNKLTSADDRSILDPAINPPVGEGISGSGMRGNEGETRSNRRGGTVRGKRSSESRGAAPLRSSERIATRRSTCPCPRVDNPTDQGENSALREGATIPATGVMDSNRPAMEVGGGTGGIIIDLDYPGSANGADGEDGQSYHPVSPRTSVHDDGGRHDKRLKGYDLNDMGVDATDVNFPADGVDTAKGNGISCGGSSLMVSIGSASTTSVEKGKQIIEVNDGETKENGHDATVMGFKLGTADLDALCEIAERELRTQRQMEEENLEVEKFPKKEKKRHPRRNPQEDLNMARQMAPDLAFWKSDGSSYRLENNDNDGSSHEVWPGPLSTYFEMMKMRGERLAAREKKLASNPDTPSIIEWRPSREGDAHQFFRLRPSLKDLCMANICANIEDVTSFEGIPDEILIEIGYALCASRRMNSRALGLILRESQVEVRIIDCSNVTEKDLREAWFAMRTFDKLKVLHLDLSGRCVSDNMLQAASSCFSRKNSGLISLSLKGAYQLTDAGLLALVSAAPALSSINLSDCTSLTEAGIYELADQLTTSLKELYIDGCQQLDAMTMLHSLLKLKNLEVLSVAGIQSVSDTFVSKLVSVHGPKLKVLVLSDCGNLTDNSIRAVAAQCSGLSTLSLNNLHNLTDAAIRSLADGCRSIEVLTVNRCSFSDEAISAFLGASGKSLTDFSVNGVKEVAQSTALSIAGCCTRRLVRLDLSWCRKLTDEALGLIADSCVSLRELKLFGCTQVTTKFLDGHSNYQLQIIGLGGNCLIQKDFATLI